MILTLELVGACQDACTAGFLLRDISAATGVGFGRRHGSVLLFFCICQDVLNVVLSNY